MAPYTVTTRPLTRDDLPLLHRWLNTPHVREWWRGEPATPTDIARKYEPRIDGVVPTGMFIIELRGEAIGLIQCYRHADHPDWDRAVDINAAAGIDYLIGDAGQRGQGVGSAAIASFTPRVFAWYPDVEVILAAPQADNYASRRALEKAGSPCSRNVNSTPTTHPTPTPARSTPSHDLRETVLGFVFGGVTSEALSAWHRSHRHQCLDGLL